MIQTNEFSSGVVEGVKYCGADDFFGEPPTFDLKILGLLNANILPISSMIPTN